MSYDFLLWVAVLAYGVHIVEEMLFDWRGWARSFLKLPAEWNEFYLFNAFVVLYGCVSAALGWKCPVISLSYVAFMAINAVFFHMLPVIISRRFSPGLFTAILIFLPVAALVFWGAWRDNVISAGVLAGSVLLGAAFMMYPIVLQKLKTKPFFRQL